MENAAARGIQKKKRDISPQIIDPPGSNSGGNDSNNQSRITENKSDQQYGARGINNSSKYMGSNIDT